jgi:hypothetical protein
MPQIAIGLKAIDGAIVELCAVPLTLPELRGDELASE